MGKAGIVLEIDNNVPVHQKKRSTSAIFFYSDTAVLQSPQVQPQEQPRQARPRANPSR